jgi:hypothetical protein
MSSEEELLRLQKILAAAIVIVALSVGVGGFDTLKIWYQLDLTETQTDYDGWDIDEESELKFSLEGLEIEYSRTTDYNDGSESSSTSESYDVDYGEDGIFEETESAMANIQRGGYLVAALILFVIWKLQEMKAETNEEIRGEIITQIRNALKGAGALVALILLYYLSGAGLEDDFDALFIGETDGDYYSSYFGIDCEAAWNNKPQFEWNGKSKFSYDDDICPDNSYPIYGSGEMDASLKLGFFAFAGSLVPIYFAFSNINPQLVLFSVPSVPNIPVQGMAVNPPPSFVENKPVVHRKVTVQRKKETTYQEPEISVMAIPEDEND